MGDTSARHEDEFPSTAFGSGWHVMPGAHVVILDDRDRSKDSLRAIVERAGFRATQTMSAAQALGLAMTTPIGAVIADIDLRGDIRDALWLLHRVRTTAGLAHIPVIGVTERASLQSLYTQAGFLTVLVEPVTPADIRGVLRALTTMDRSA